MTQAKPQLSVRAVVALRRLWRRMGGWLDRHGLPPLPAYLSLSLGAFLIAFEWYALRLWYWAEAQWEVAARREMLLEHGSVTLGVVVLLFVALGALALMVGMAMGRRRTWGTLSYLRKCCIVGYAMVFVAAYGIYDVTAVLIQLSPLPGRGEALFYNRYELMWPLGLLFIFAGITHLIAWRRVTMRWYRPDEPDAGLAVGDRILENLRRHGDDPPYRKSVLSSISLHVLVVVGPLLLMRTGCVEDYEIPAGEGNPVVNLVRMVKPKKKEKKQFVLRPDSAIYFAIPDLDDSPILEQVDEQSQITYVADPNAAHSKMGKGGKGKGGWPDGTGDRPIRFIRLEYRGTDWDDGMDARARADLNFLTAFNKRTGFKVADHPESVTISQLRSFTKGYAPPFVYMTGSSSINLSPQEMRILREYLLDGGMLFADAGSSAWDRSFRGVMNALFPDKPLITVSDDDPIFQYPFVFPNGAPPLWHHGGFKAMGIKHRERWVVFYHPGDVNDAWKTGHSGMDKALAEASFDLGTNIIYYAFTHYLEETRKYRK